MHKNKAFVVFAECERKMYAISQEIEKLNSQLSSLESSLDAIKKKELAAEQALQGAQKEIHATELELKTLESQEVEKKRRLMATKAAKEYESLLKEIDHIAHKKSALEDSVFALWEARDKALEHKQMTEQEAQQEIGKLNQEIAQKQHERNLLEKQSVEIEKSSDEAAKFVDPTLLTTYRSMQEAVALPAAPIEGGSCSSCFYAVPSQDSGKAEKGEIVNCKECYRLLYIVKPLP